jgi:hypothetical protein
MIVSAVNAMTMTPARDAWIFAARKPGEHGDQGKEALPWWSFALLGGFVGAWLLTSTFGARVGIPIGGERGEILANCKRHFERGSLTASRFCQAQSAVAHSAGSRFDS